MKKLLLILLCLPMIFSCWGKKEESKDGGSLDKEITIGMLLCGYTGKGTYTYATGAKYEGEFKDGERNGQGTYTKADGSKYVGELKDDKTHGQGTLTSANGDKYVGEWKDGKRNGQGTFTWQNPWEKYVGEWKDGDKHGQGTYTSSDGTVTKGLWENDEFLGE